jgi:hypothetical protein
MSGIDNAKQAMGWKAPAERACCENCKHVRQVNPSVHPTVLCGKAGFYTKRNAICNDWADAVGVRG